ncbi:MAG: transglutaminase-like domain-containing protein [bacterium]
MKRPVSTLLICCCLLGLALPASPAIAAGIPAVSDAELARALELAGANAPELQSALDASADDGTRRAAMRFTVASLPTCDLGSITSAELTANLDMALSVRTDFPWGSDCDLASWAHFVLPPRVSQEPLSDWRRFFLAELGNELSGATTLDEAAVLVNKWCGQRVGFKQTQRRDQGPLATLASGYGRCEEMVIFYVDACRSVGIPARMAYCPYWAVSDNNHAWVEVLGSDGNWHYTGGCEPRDQLDDAWFNGAVKNAPLICSMAFGVPDTLDDSVLEVERTVGARYTRFNSTAFYRDTGLLSVEVPTAAGSTDAHVSVHVFNFGALRQIAHVQLDSQGRARIRLGLGSFVITTDAPVETRQTLVEISAGEITELYWDSLPELDSQILLQFPPDAA